MVSILITKVLKNKSNSSTLTLPEKGFSETLRKVAASVEIKATGGRDLGQEEENPLKGKQAVERYLFVNLVVLYKVYTQNKLYWGCVTGLGMHFPAYLYDGCTVPVVCLDVSSIHL